MIHDNLLCIKFIDVTDASDWGVMIDWSPQDKAKLYSYGYDNVGFNLFMLICFVRNAFT